MKTLFLSYCSKDKPIADLVENKLNNLLGNQIRISRYERDVKYRDSFKAFMNTLSEHDFVLTIVSDSYLKSPGCLYEIGEVVNIPRFEEKLHFIVLSAEDESYYNFKPGEERFPIYANIHSTAGCLTYFDYWNRLNADEKSRLQGYPMSQRYPFEEDHSRQEKNSLYDLTEFLHYLKYADAIPLSEMIKTNFKPMIEQMFPNLNLEKYHFASLDIALEYYIKRITEITKTDYNQIILKGQSGSHSDAKFVVADMISAQKQHYIQVASNSVISHCINTGTVVNLKNVFDCPKYMIAVPQTKSELVVPVIIKGICVGAINSEAEQYNYYTEEIERELINISDLLAISLSFLDFQVDMKISNLPYISLPITN